MGELTNWRDRATITVDEYAAIIGVSRATAYAAVRAGDVATLHIRDRWLVCVPALLRQLEGLPASDGEEQIVGAELVRRLQRNGDEPETA